jgi:hypothetical protein
MFMLHSLLSIFATVGDKCDPSGGSFLAFPTWYRYLDGIVDVNGKCSPTINGLNDIWLIVAAIIEILLRVAAIATVAAIIYGAFTYTTSQGEPEATAKAKNTLINALVGLAIAVLAASIISFIAGSL